METAKPGSIGRDASQFDALPDHIKRNELTAEKHQQKILEGMVSVCNFKSSPQGSGIAARRNIDNYLSATATQENARIKILRSLIEETIESMHFA